MTCAPLTPGFLLHSQRWAVSPQVGSQEAEMEAHQ